MKGTCGSKGFSLLVGIVFLVLASSGQVGASEFGGAVPLWEPAWSPVIMLPGSVMQMPMDDPNALCAVDIDGDGIDEIIVGGDYLHLFSLHDGEISRRYLMTFLGPERRVGPSGEPLMVAAIAAGDLDDDGLVDLVVVTQQGTLWAFRNHGRWGFQWGWGSPHSVNGTKVFLCDQDGDGDLDVVVSDWNRLWLLSQEGGRLGAAEELSVLEGRIRDGASGVYRGKPGLFIRTEQGLWFFPQGEEPGIQVFEEGGRSLVAADFDGDGVVDLAVCGDQEIRLYLGNAQGFSEPWTSSVAHPVSWLLASDHNGDGWPDLVAGSSSPGGFSVYYNREGEELLGPYRHGIKVSALGSFPTSALAGTAADFDGDGKDDLVVAASLGHIAFLSTQIKGRSLQAIPGSFLLESVDFDGDGVEDLLASTARGGVSVLVNSGYGTFNEEPLVGRSGRGDRDPYIARLGDVTGDGEQELVVFEFADDFRSAARVTVWDLKSREEPLWSRPVGLEIRPVLVLSDQTGDGVWDVVAGAGETIVLLHHKPTAEWPERVEIPWGGPVGPLVGIQLAAGDAVAGLRVGAEVELLLLRDGVIQEAEISLSLAPLDMVAADMDTDGATDLVIIGWGAKEEELAIVVAIGWGDGNGGFRFEYFPIPGWPPTAMPFPYGGLVVEDLDGDGKVELAAMRFPDQQGTPGGVVVIPWTVDGPGEPQLLSGCVGVKLLAVAAPRLGRVLLATVAEGIPAQLCIVSWR